MVKEKIKLIKGDITDMDVDAIVNAANTDLILGAGVAGAIRRKGGPAIQKQCDEIGPIPLGEAAITTGGNLKARFVIHAASMGSGTLTTAQSLADSTLNSLKRAEEKGLKSIAFPAIGTGVAGFPTDECARIMLAEVMNYLSTNQASSMKEVHFVLYDDATYETFNQIFEKIKD